MVDPKRSSVLFSWEKGQDSFEPVNILPWGRKASAYNSGCAVLSNLYQVILTTKQGNSMTLNFTLLLNVKLNTEKLFLLWVYESCSKMQKALRTVLSGECGNMTHSSSCAHF